MNGGDVNWEEKNQFPVYNWGQLPCCYPDINQNPNIDCAVPRVVPGLHLIPIHLIQPYWLLLILFWEPNSNSRSHSHVSLRATLPLRPGYRGCDLWEYKRKQRQIPKKEREKEKKEGFPSLLNTFYLKIFSKITDCYTTFPSYFWWWKIRICRFFLAFWALKRNSQG